MAPWQLPLLPILSMLLLLAARSASSRPLEEQEEADAAVELTKNSFNQTLWAAPATFALVEFYAHWCPVCRIYKPQYSKVAKLFNGRTAVHPGEVFMGKVDCAEDANTPICRRFQVDHYPSLYWGHPGKLAWESFDPKDSKASSGIELIPKTPRTAEALLAWINERIGKSYTLNDEARETTRASIVEQIQPMMSLYDIEESTALSYKFILQSEMLNAKTRASFLHFLQLLAVHHPSKRCREGSANILVHFEDIWLAGENAKPNGDLLMRLQICGERTSTDEWITCRGSKNYTRGYSCGLWLLFHALSVRVEDSESKTAIQTIRDFIASFFNCEDCRDHFLTMSTSAADSINSRRDLVLWFWRAHNQVNKRVGDAEAESKTGDPKFPKQQWPPKELCTACKKDGDQWDESAVYTFLTELYGRALVSIPEEKLDAALRKSSKAEVAVPDESSSTSRVAVPIGAAFGIGMASCGFGIVACFWRMQQKRKKLLRRRV
ncbi:sulfhydryl oxidase 2 isoform X2 [Selaginella moellendorffii]|nr:sulfhydryl oxidase 2 isoform X2 [Selaginella moellendorffii]|eukprot:XP_024523489.1 sulfhydryl oxidase 2 isoform X2 [Selaginella moellendorffii]